MTKSLRGAPALRAAAFPMVLFLAACQSSDTIAPDGATIDLTASPAQIILASGVQVTPVTLLATVRNSSGLPLPGQDVRFTTSSGALTPTAGTPVETDDDGNATAVLTGATTGPTITAKSGKASAMLTLQAATGNLSSILLSPGPVNLSTCSDTFDFIAVARDPNGDPVGGVTIVFEFVPGSTTGVTGTFRPNNGVSDDTTGEVPTELDIDDNDCNTKCVPVGKDCRVEIRAKDLGGTVISPSVTILDGIN